MKMFVWNSTHRGWDNRRWYVVMAENVEVARTVAIERAKKENHTFDATVIELNEPDEMGENYALYFETV